MRGGSTAGTSMPGDGRRRHAVWSVARRHAKAPMSPRLIQRHDQFFKRLLDKPGAAGALLREWLPAEIAGRLGDDPPELLPGSFVPAELMEYRTDRLYRATTRTGRPALVHVVVEHKSAPDPLVALQLLGYKAQILQWWHRTEGRASARTVPAVVSMVVYHGAAPWTVPLSLGGITDADDDMRLYLPDFRYTLVDLGRIEDARLSRETVLRVGFLILKYGTRDEDLRRTLLTLGRATLALGMDDLVAMVRYVLGEPNQVEAGVLREVLAEIVPGKEERVMSIALEQFKAEAFKHGMAQGEAKGRATTLSKLLSRKFGELPPTVRARIEAASLEELDSWTDAVLDAPTLDRVFESH